MKFKKEKLIKSLLFICCFFVTNSCIWAQNPGWGFNLGSNTDDMSRVCKIAPNGNVCVAGKFSGTIDLDPGAGTHNITSNGLDDIYLACYTAGGNFLWGFNIGGSSYDGAWYMTIDGSSNIVISGYVQSGGIDFDPGAGSTTLTYAGGTGTPFYGDGFVAKYTATGNFVWANELGGSTVYDVTVALATDNANNIYVGGTFIGSMAVSSTSTLSSSTAGNAYILKYNPAGNLIWGHNYGMPGTGGNDCFPRSLQVSNGYIYVGGFFQGTANFNPWGSGSMLTSVGTYDPYIAKYDTAGNFRFVKQMAGSGSNDEIQAVAIDSVNSMYVSGYTNSATFTFDPSAASTTTVIPPGGGGNTDMWLAKYDSAGRYMWGHIMGSTGNEYGYVTDINNGFLYCAGSFEQTVDFDPSSIVNSLTSNGGSDVFVTKYTLNGDYVCGFNVGDSTADDIAFGLTHDDSSHVFVTGQFGGTAIDFDPTSLSYPITSNGSNDAFVVKYNWVNDTLLSGNISGDTICYGQTAHLTLHITSSSAGPYNITLSNGATTFTVSGVNSGVPFVLPISPLVTTTYTVISVIPAGLTMCYLPPGYIFGTPTVFVHRVTASITDSIINCNTVVFTTPAGDSSYLWSFSDGGTSTLNSVTHTYTVTGIATITVQVTDTNGCHFADTLQLNIVTAVNVNLGRDSTICSISPFLLQSPFSYPASAKYLWSTGDTTASITVTGSGRYWLKVSEGTCFGIDTVNLKLIPKPVVQLGNDTNICNYAPYILRSLQPSGSIFSWNTGATGNSITVTSSGTYSLFVNDSGCITGDSIRITIIPVPKVNLGNDISVCEGSLVVLQSSDTVSFASYQWSTGASTNSIFATASGTYWLTVTQNGCHKTDTVLVNLKPNPPVNLGNDISFCEGASVTLTSAEPAGAQYIWSNGSTGSTLTVTASGIYGLVVTLNGCISSDSIQVFEVKPPTIELGPDTTVCIGYPIQLFINADEGSYLWSNGSTANNFTITDDGIYWAIINNICGTAADTISVKHEFCNLWFPTAFSPNGDGKNEIIRVRGIFDAFSNYSLSIYNRWGERLFFTEDFNAGWDGYYKNEIQEINTYYYMILYTLNGKKHVMKGDFQLVR